MRSKALVGLAWLLSGACVAHSQTTPTARYQTVAEMVAATVPNVITNSQARITALAAGRNTANDGGGGVFFFVPGATTVTNRGTVHPATVSGRWLRDYQGPLNILWFGAYKDGSNEAATTTAIQNAIDTAAGAAYNATTSGIDAQGIRVFVPAGLYSINDTLRIGKSNLANVTYSFVGDGRESTKLVWKGAASSSLLSLFHPSPGQNNIRGFILKDFAVENPLTGADTRAANVDGILLVGNVNPIVSGNVAGLNECLVENIRFQGFDNGLHVFGSVNNLQIQRCSFGVTYHQLTTQTASKTDALTDRRGNCILFDGDYDNPVGTITIPTQIWIRNNVFLGYQSYAVDFYRVSQFVFSDNSIYSVDWDRSGGLRVRSGNGGYISGNFTQSDDGDGYNNMFGLGTVGLGSSEVSGYTFVGNTVNAVQNPVAPGSALYVGVADGVFIAGNTFNLCARGINLAATVTNCFIGVNNYLSVATKLTDGGAKSLHIIDEQLGNAIDGATVFDDSITLGSLGNVTGGSANSLMIRGAGATGAGAGAIHWGDNSAGGSRQFTWLNGHNGAGQVAGTFNLIAGSAVNTDPVTDAGRAVIMSASASGPLTIRDRLVVQSGSGNYTGGSSNEVIIAGSSTSALNVSALQFGDNFAGGSRQFAVANGHSGAGGTPGTLNVLRANVLNTDPLASARTTVLSLSDTEAVMSGLLRIGANNAGGITGGQNNNLLVPGTSAAAANAAAIQLGDNFGGGSRQWAIVNGHSGAAQVVGTLHFLVANLINTDPLSAARTTALSLTSAGAGTVASDFTVNGDFDVPTGRAEIGQGTGTGELEVTRGTNAIIRITSSFVSPTTGDKFGRIQWWTADGDGAHVGAEIIAEADEAFGRSTRLGFWTQSVGGATTEKVRVSSNGDTAVKAGDFILETAGKGLQVKEGVNARMGADVLNGASPSTVTVANTSVTASTRIFLTINAPGVAPGFVYVSARVAATSFTITGANTDTSTVAWLLIEPSP